MGALMIVGTVLAWYVLGKGAVRMYRINRYLERRARREHFRRGLRRAA